VTTVTGGSVDVTVGVKVKVEVGVSVAVGVRVRVGVTVGARNEAEGGRKRLNRHENTTAASTKPIMRRSVCGHPVNIS
jgi:hypothetical protein